MTKKLKYLRHKRYIKFNLAKTKIRQGIIRIRQDLQPQNYTMEVPKWLLDNDNFFDDLCKVQNMDHLRALYNKHGTRYLLNRRQLRYYADIRIVPNFNKLEILMRQYIQRMQDWDERTTQLLE